MRAKHGLAAALCAALAIAVRAQPVPGAYDVIIRGGRVVDGTGNPWFAADVAIKGGRIAAVSNRLATTTSAVIDKGEHTGAKPGVAIRGHGFKSRAASSSAAR